MAIVRRATNKDATWARAWTVDTATAELPLIPGPRRGDVAYAIDTGLYYIWFDDDTWKAVPIGDIVGTTDTQTLTNKTLTGPATTNYLRFPVTQVPSSGATDLDDYVEGTFTPFLQGSTGAGTFTYTNQRGAYEKIGRMVRVSMWIKISAITVAPTGFLQIGGLPFSGNAFELPGALFYLYNGLTLPAGGTMVGAQLGTSGTVLTCVYSGSGIASAGLNVSAMTAPAELRGGINYRV